MWMLSENDAVFAKNRPDKSYFQNRFSLLGSLGTVASGVKLKKT